MEASLERLVPPDVRVMAVRACRPFSTIERTIRGQAREALPGDDRGSSERSRGGGRRSRWLTHLARVKDVIDGMLAIPDKESGWIVPAVLRGLMHMAARGRPDVIYSSAPPWSGQAVAWVLAALSGRPWVADFRDPWARAPARDWRLRFRQRAVERLERQVVGRADAVLFVTRANRDEFAAFYGPAAARRFHLVPNGCDPTEFEGLTPAPAAGMFVLLHAGTFYGPRNPLPILRAVASAIGRRALDPATFRLRLLGTNSLAFDLAAESRRLGIEQVVEVLPRASRAETLQQMVSASALLLVQTNTTVSIPGKAYEYLAAGRPVLALSEEGETAELVRASGAGVVVRPDEPVAAIEAALLEIVARGGRRVVPAESALFDGRVHAATTERLLHEFARRGRRRSSAVQVAPGGPAAMTKESRR
jgi:glycosyltransferase involved in cell wall biosynthesis